MQAESESAASTTQGNHKKQSDINTRMEESGRKTKRTTMKAEEIGLTIYTLNLKGGQGKISLRKS